MLRWSTNLNFSYQQNVDIRHACTSLLHICLRTESCLWKECLAYVSYNFCVRMHNYAQLRVPRNTEGAPYRFMCPTWLPKMAAQVLSAQSSISWTYQLRSISEFCGPRLFSLPVLFSFVHLVGSISEFCGRSLFGRIIFVCAPLALKQLRALLNPEVRDSHQVYCLLTLSLSVYCVQYKR